MQPTLRPLARILVVAVLGIGFVIGSSPMQCLASPPPSPTNSQSQAESPLGSADALVSFIDNRLIIRANAVPLEKILAIVTRETGVAFFLQGPAETPVTADFETGDLEKGIKRLIRGLNSVFYYGPSQPGAKEIKLTSVFVISNRDIRTISAIRPSSIEADPGHDPGAVPGHGPLADIERLEEAAFDDDEGAINELARLAEFEENKLKRLAALEALGESDAPQYADLLFNLALKDIDDDVRVAAVEALGNLTSGQEATDYLLQTLDDQNPQVRAAAVEALASAGDENITDTLMQALKDDGSMVRAAAAEALADIGDKSTAPALIEALEDTDEEVREYAKEALEEMGIRKGSPEKRRGISPPPRE